MMLRPGPTSEPLIEIAGLSKTFVTEDGPFDALSDINLSVARGEFLAVVGPSGCGKSTLMRCIAGLETLTEGSVSVEGRPVREPPRQMGVVFQRDILLDWRTVIDNVTLVAEFRRRDMRELRPRADQLLARFGLEQFRNRHPWELSGGMRQRVAICRALLDDPELLLMDEPFGALDALTRDDLNLELARLWQETKKTIVFITHGISEAVFLADRVVVMARNPGRIVKTVNIDLPRPRRLAARETEQFGGYVAAVRSELAALGLIGTD
jgi:NitT/TauT family transport system ATP-binding protein